MINDRSSNVVQNCGDGEPAAIPATVVDAAAGDTAAAQATNQPAHVRTAEGSIPDERIYLVGNKVLARGTGLDLPPWSIGVYCQLCGNVWARVVSTLKRPDTIQQWVFQESLCMAHISTHGTRWHVPGSIIPALRSYTTALSRDYSWESHLPDAVLAREAAIHLRWWNERGRELNK